MTPGTPDIAELTSEQLATEADDLVALVAEKLKPFVQKFADDLSADVHYYIEDSLQRNVRFNIASVINGARRQAESDRASLLASAEENARLRADQAAFDLLLTEFSKSQFMVTGSDGSRDRSTLEFSWIGEGRRERCEALEDAIRAVAKVAQARAALGAPK